MTHQRFLEVRHTQESFTAQPLVARTLGWGKVRCTCISNGKLSCCNTEMPSSVGHCHFTGHCSHLFGKRTWNVLGVPDWKWHTSFLPTFQNSHVQGSLGSVIQSCDQLPSHCSCPCLPLTYWVPAADLPSVHQRPQFFYLRPLQMLCPLPKRLCFLLAWLIPLPQAF